MLNEQLQEKWKPILEHEDLGPIKDPHRRSVTATILENTVEALSRTAQYDQGGGLLTETNPP